MANLYRSLRGRTPYGLWMWVALVQCLFNLLTLPADCRGASDNPVSIYPSTYIYVNYSDPLEIFCVDETSSSVNLEFSVGTNVIPSEIVNATTRRLYIEKLNKQVITYTCKNNKTTNSRFTRVLVDSPPINVMDFTCRSENLEVLNCTWSTPQNYSVYNYNLTFLIYGNPVEQCDVQEIGHLKFSCAWNTYTPPRYHQMEKTYIFKLTSCNVFGCNIQLITVDHFSIVKPKPPKDLVVVYNHTHSVLLQWKIDINLHLLPDGVDHRIEYQIAKIDNVTYFRSVDASSLPPNNRTYKFLLSELPYAHMQYEVRIYIRCKTAPNNAPWSDFTYTIIYTASERPNRPPDTIVGAFGQTLFDAKRMIYIYWKQLEEYEEAGENFTYKVVASPHKNNYQTIIADKSKSLSYVLLDNATLDAIDISIWSMNEKGSSTNSSYIYIPPKTATIQPKVTSFTKLAYENGTYKLAWGEVSDIDNYTIFWCIHNTTEVCVGRMDFAVIEPNRTSYVLDLPKDNRYQFAISANSGKNTSGMVWAICEIFQDTIQLYRFPMKMDRDAAGPSYVPLKWKTDCILQDGAINGYQISYCPVLATSDVCASKDLKTISINNPKQMSENITDLEPYTTYLFTLAMNTSSGLKTLDNVSATTVEDTPTSPVNITICEIRHNSMNVSWDPPLHKNGIIGRYLIKNYNTEIFEFTVPENDKESRSRRVVNITGLSGFTNYSLTVEACNNAINSCSIIGPDDAIIVRTRIGPPAKLKTPTLGPNIVSWEPPEKPGGIVSLYQLQRVKDGNNHEEIFNTTNLEFQLVQCDGGVGAETYRVRAVNFDEDQYYGAYSSRKEVYLPHRNDTSLLEYAGEWSDGARIACGGKDGLLMTFILMAVFALMGLMYSTIKCYKKYRKMEDIKPVLPNGLGIPEKDIAKYSFGGWNPANKDEKPSSDEMLLLPNSRTTVSTSELKQKENDNCASSDQTDSTVLSDTSHAPVDRQVSTSDDGSDSSLHLEVEAARIEDKDTNQEYEDLSSSDEISQNASPYYGENVIKKTSGSGYVQQPVHSGSGYVQSAPFAIKSPPLNLSAPNANSSYVMASLSTPIFTTGVPQPNTSHTPAASGYVRPEDAQRQVGLNVPKLGPPLTRMFGPESLPTMPTLPSPAKLGADNSYIQLQSLDTLPSHKQPVHNTVPLKSQTSSGYVSPGDAVMNKHLNNMLSGGHISEESAILDPTMSPDAYCRFSWSTDPANDNLHSLLADSPKINSSNK